MQMLRGVQAFQKPRGHQTQRRNAQGFLSLIITYFNENEGATAPSYVADSVEGVADGLLGPRRLLRRQVDEIVNALVGSHLSSASALRFQGENAVFGNAKFTDGLMQAAGAGNSHGVKGHLSSPFFSIP